MGRRTNAMLLLLAVLMTAYALVFERKRADVFGGPGKLFAGLEPADVIRLEIEYLGPDAAQRAGWYPAAGTGVVIKLARRGEYEWWIEKPFRFPGLLPRIQGLTWGLADLVEIDRIPPEAAAFRDAVPSGGPDMVIRFGTRQGQERAIELGRDYPEPSMDYMYVRVDRSEVYVVRRELRRTFAVALSDLRSRALFPIARPDAVSLKIEARDPRWNKQLRREPGESWFFTGDPDLEGVLADRLQLGKLIDELNAWKVDAFELDSEEDLGPGPLAAYGLAEPELRITGKHENGLEVVLEVGSEIERDGRKLVYVRQSGGPHVVTAARDPVDLLRREPEDLRTVHVFDFEGAVVERVDCAGPAGSFALVRRQVEESSTDKGETQDFHEDRWLIVEPGGTSEIPGDRHLISIAVAELQELLIRYFLSILPQSSGTSGFDKQVSVTVAGGKKHTLILGPLWEGRGDRDLQFYEGLRSTDRSRFVVETPWPRRLEIGAVVFRNRAISVLEPRRVYGIEVRSVKRSWQLARPPSRSWSLPAGEKLLPGMELDGKLIDQLVSVLGRDTFRVREFDPSLEKSDFDRWGIGRTEFHHVVTLSHVEGDYKGFRSLIVGHQKPSVTPELYYARADTEDVALLLEAGLPELLARVVDHLEAITGTP